MSPTSAEPNQAQDPGTGEGQEKACISLKQARNHDLIRPRAAVGMGLT